MRDETPKIVRDQFEAVLYDNYNRSVTAQMLQSKEPGKPKDKATWFKRDANGDYEDLSVAAMWLAWKLAMQANGATFGQAGLWSAFAAVQDRIDAELPQGYTIALAWEKHDGQPGNYVLLEDADGNEVDYPDVPNPEAQGSFMRIILSALEAAKADHARRLN